MAVDPLTFLQAREMVLRTVEAATPGTETIDILSACGRVLAEEIAADRDSPALDRSVRDGYAVRASDIPGELQVIGEVRAGQSFEGEIAAGQTVEIMTGAPMPAGANAVVMVEYTTRNGDFMRTDQSAEAGQNINPRACEAAAGETLLAPGKRLDYTDISLAATLGRARVSVYRKPMAAIISTGDEVVEVTEQPRDYEVRNSNAYALAVQVGRAGGRAKILPIARDTVEHTLQTVESGLSCDLILLSGGVSAGKYDVVEQVLASLGATFYFDRVRIQPGQPLVFGKVRGKFFFGLPGNPSSTMVTFEIFARAALERLGGQRETSLHMPFARLTKPFRHRAGLTRFLPASLSADGAEITPVKWHGSGDVPAMSRANAYLVADPDRAEYSAGELIRVLAK